MSISKAKVEEDVKFYENQRDQAKEIFIGAMASIKALKKLLEEVKK